MLRILKKSILYAQEVKYKFLTIPVIYWAFIIPILMLLIIIIKVILLIVFKGYIACMPSVFRSYENQWLVVANTTFLFRPAEVEVVPDFVSDTSDESVDSTEPNTPVLWEHESPEYFESLGIESEDPYYFMVSMTGVEDKIPHPRLQLPFREYGAEEGVFDDVPGIMSWAQKFYPYHCEVLSPNGYLVTTKSYIPDYSHTILFKYIDHVQIFTRLPFGTLEHMCQTGHWVECIEVGGLVQVTNLEHSAPLIMLLP